MAEIVVMPKMNLTMEEGVLSCWYKSEGDSVGIDEPLCNVENDKVAEDVLSMFSGVILKIWGESGEKYPVSAPIALIGGIDEEISEIIAEAEKRLAVLTVNSDNTEQEEIKRKIPAAAQETASESNIKMLPKLRKLIREKGIEIDALVKFCGKTRITEQDILDYESSKFPPQETGGEKRRLKMSGMRRTIADRMSKSCKTTARLTNVTETDMTELMKKLKELKKKGRNISVTAVIIKACALALREHEIINSSLDDERNEIIFHGEINVGCAVDVPNGLFVPVIKEADKKDLEKISEEIREFTERGQRSSLTGEDMSGGTFTVSNVGMLGVESFTPIINYPQAAIMGVGTISRLPRYLDDESEILVPRHIMKLSLTYDHRIVDGAPAARFSLRVRELLENPYEIFMQGQ